MAITHKIKLTYELYGKILNTQIVEDVEMIDIHSFMLEVSDPEGTTGIYYHEDCKVTVEFLD